MYVIYIAIGRLVCCLVALCGVCIFHTVQLCRVFDLWVSGVIFQDISIYAGVAMVMCVYVCFRCVVLSE